MLAVRAGHERRDRRDVGPIQDFGEPARLSSLKKSDKYNAIVKRSSGVMRPARSIFSFESRSLNLLGRRRRSVGIVCRLGFMQTSMHRSLAKE
jgi:hypothetical protein